jgi:hypothetical protein
MIYGDDESSSEYDDRRRRSQSVDDDEEEEEEGDSEDDGNAMQVDTEGDSVPIAVSDDERPRKKPRKSKKPASAKSPKKATTPKKRKREVEHVDEIDNFDDFQDEQANTALPPSKRAKKGSAASTTPKRAVSEFDSGIFAESPQVPQEAKKNPKPAPVRETQQKPAEVQKKNKKAEDRRPASLELAASSLSAGADSIDDFLTSRTYPALSRETHETI